MSIPKRYKLFHEKYPEAAKAYEALGEAVHRAGPLDEKTRALIKLAISAGARLEGGVHSHARKAIKAGCSPDELKHIALLSIPTLGLPSSMAVMSWIEDVTEKQDE